MLYFYASPGFAQLPRKAANVCRAVSDRLRPISIIIIIIRPDASAEKRLRMYIGPICNEPSARSALLMCFENTT